MARGRQYGAAAEFARKQFGGDLVESEDVVNIGIVSEQLLRPDPERVFVFLLNLGSTTVFLKTIGNPAVDNGVRLSAQGGSLSFNVQDDGTMPAKGWNAIAQTSAADVYVLALRRSGITPPEVG